MPEQRSAEQRTAAHVLLSGPGGPDGPAGVLLVDAGPAGWRLPGGIVGHGEPPADAAARGAHEQTGLDVAAGRPLSATADLGEVDGVLQHTVRLLYGAALRPDGPSRPPAGAAAFVRPGRLAELPLAPFTAEFLGLAAPPDPPDPPDAEHPHAPSGPRVLPAVRPPSDPGESVRVQRAAAYAVLRSGEALLLTHLAGTVGRWTLPGGGIDHGEPPVTALVREVYEEAGLELTPGPLLEIGSNHFTGRAPSGRLEDFHAIQLIYAGEVPAGAAPHVVEEGGSTDAVAWVPLARAGQLRLTNPARIALRLAAG